LLDIERSESQSDGLGRDANISAELRRISHFQLLPRYELRKQHPAVGGVKCAAKRQVKGFDRKLTAMLLPVHLWQSAVAAFNKCQLLGKFTSPEQLKQAAAQWICLFQEALLKTARKIAHSAPASHGQTSRDNASRLMRWTRFRIFRGDINPQLRLSACFLC